MNLLDGHYYIRYSDSVAEKIEKAFEDINTSSVSVKGAKAFITEQIPTITLHDKIESASVDMNSIFVARI